MNDPDRAIELYCAEHEIDPDALRVVCWMLIWASVIDLLSPMPVRVVKRGKRWATVDRAGKVHGYSSSKAKADSSARAINGAKHGFKPTGKARGGR